MTRTTQIATIVAIATGLACLPALSAAVTAPDAADAHTTSGSGNYGKKTALEVEGPPDSATVKDGYIRFDLSVLPPGIVGADVTKATLRLFVSKIRADGSFDVYRVTSAWTELGITAGTAPTLGGVPEVGASNIAVAASDLYQYRSVDVTALVRDWVDGLANNGVAIVANGTNGLKAKFDSKESRSTSQAPWLDITLNPAVASSDIVDATITAADIANAAVTGSKIAAGTISGSNIATGAVTSSNILDATVTGTDIANGSVGLVDINFSGGNIDLSNSSSSSVGNITKAGGRFVHNFGTNNTFLGADAGSFALSTANGDTGIGVQALSGLTTGFQDTAVGYFALRSNTSGDRNTAIGSQALGANTSGGFNTAVGEEALSNNSGGNSNVAVGQTALVNNTSGAGNIAIGSFGGGNLTTGSNNIDIGNAGVAGESNKIRIGTVGTQTDTFIAGIFGNVTAGSAVYVNASGQLSTTPSSARYKVDIREMGDASSVLMKLRPVQFRYRPDIDSSGALQYGLVAEEVARIDPNLVLYGEGGKIETVRYNLINAMLLNELQKQHEQQLGCIREVRTLQQEYTQLAQAQRENGKLASENAALRERVRKVEQIVEDLASRSAVTAFRVAQSRR